jgi:hypothetical protein
MPEAACRPERIAVITVTMKYAEFGIGKSDTFGAEGCCTVLSAKLVVSQARPTPSSPYEGGGVERSDPLGAAFFAQIRGFKSVENLTLGICTRGSATGG